MRTLYVDGNALACEIELLAKYIDVPKVPFDYGQFFNNLNADRVYYYDAWPQKKQNELDAEFKLRENEKETFFRFLNRTANVRVRSGTTRWGRRQGQHQKGVDVLLAVDVLSHVLSGATDHVTLVVSDLDFYPIFDALHQTRVKSLLVYSMGNTSDELIGAADTAMSLTRTFLLQACKPAFHQQYLEIHSETNWNRLTDEERTEYSFSKHEGMEIALKKDIGEHFVLRWNGQLVKSKYLDIAIEHLFGAAVEAMVFTGGERYRSM